MTTKAVLLLLLMTSAIYFLRFSPQIYEKTSSSLRNLENTEAMTILCGTSDNSSWYNIYQNQTEGRILEFLQTIHPQNQVINYINSGQANSSNLTQIALTYGETVAPYAAVGLGAALLTFIFCFFYCFDCVCFKPCFDQDKCTQRFCSFIAIFLVIAMGGISIAGIVMGFFIPENVQVASCGGGQFLNTILVGNLSSNWIGVGPAVTALQNIANGLNGISVLQPNSSNAEDMKNLYNQGLSQISKYYTDSDGATVGNPESSGMPITPSFIQNLGPPSNNATFSGNLEVELKTRYSLSQQILTNIESASSDIHNNAANYQSQIQSGMNYMNGVNNNLTQLLTNYANLYSQFSPFVEYGKWGVISYFGIFGNAALALFAAMVCITFCGKEVCIKAAQKSWYCLSVASFFGFLITGILLPVMIISIDVCGATIQLMNNEEFYQEVVSSFMGNNSNSEISNLTKTCFFGNGEILEQLGLNVSMGQFGTIGNNIEAALQNFNPNASYSYTIPPQYEAITQFEYGLQPVTSQVGTDISTLTQYTNYEISGSPQNCHDTLDTWVLNSTNCSNAGVVFKNGESDTIDLGSKVCLGFDQYQVSGSKRYGSEFGTCQPLSSLNYDTAVIDFVDNFEVHMKDVRQVFNTLYNDLTVYNKTMTSFWADLGIAMQPVFQMSSEANGVINLVSNNQTGLLANIGCLFLKSDITNAMGGLCNTFLTNTFALMCLVLGVGIFSMIATLPVFCASKFMKKQPKKKHDSEEGIEIQNYSKK